MLVREKTALPEWRRADTEGKKPGRSIELLFPGFCSIQNKGEENGSKTEEEQPDRMDLSDRSRPHRDRVGVFHEAVIRTRPLPTLITAFFLALSFFMLERGIREFGIGMSYAIFTGIGIAGTTVLGLVFFGESAGVLKIVSLLVLLAGIIGLKFCEGDEENENSEKNEGNEGHEGERGAAAAGNAAVGGAAAGAGNCGKERD